MCRHSVSQQSARGREGSWGGPGKAPAPILSSPGWRSLLCCRWCHWTAVVCGWVGSEQRERVLSCCSALEVPQHCDVQTRSIRSHRHKPTHIFFFFNVSSISLLAKFANFESDDLDNSHFKTAFKEVFLLNWKLCVNGHNFSEKVLNWSLTYSSLFWIYFNFINYMWMVMQDSVFALEKTFPAHTLILLFAVHHSPM